MACWDLPSDTKIEWQQWCFPSKSETVVAPSHRQEASSFAKALYHRSQCQSRCAALQRIIAKRNDPKGKSPALPEPFRQETFYIQEVAPQTSATQDAKSSPSAAGPSQQEAPFPPQPSASTFDQLQPSTVIWLFQLREPSSSDIVSSDVEMSLESDSKQDVSPEILDNNFDDDDLWGGASEGDGEPASADTGDRSFQTEALFSLQKRLEGDLQKSNASFHDLSASRKPSQTGSFVLSEITPSRQNALENTQLPAIRKFWRKSIKSQLTEQLVVSRNIERFLERPDIRPKADVMQVPTNASGIADTQARSQSPTNIRPIVYMGDGLLLLPRSQYRPPRIATHSHLQRLLKGRFSVSVAAQTRETTMATLAAALPLHPSPFHAVPRIVSEEDGLVVPIPLTCQCRVVKWSVNTQDESGPYANFLPSIYAIAEELEQRTGLLLEELLENPWALLTVERQESLGIPVVQTLLWPTILCLGLEGPTAKEGELLDPVTAVQQTHSGAPPSDNYLSLSDMPLPDLLKLSSGLFVVNQNEEVDKGLFTLSQSDPKASKAPHSLDLSRDQEDSRGANRSDAHHIEEPAHQASGSKASTPQASNKAEDDDDNDDEDDDDDLFGSDDADDTMKDVSVENDTAHIEADRPSDRPAHDHEMYGLVTEDDFAFFDDEMDAVLPTQPTSTDPPSERQNTIAANVQGTSRETDPGFSVREQGPQAHSDLAKLSELDISNATYTDTAGTSGIPTDPSSMPAFTPGSFTDSSPATGGLLDRTPRTPTSPYYDPGSAVNRYPPGKHWEAGDGIDRPSGESDGLAFLPSNELTTENADAIDPLNGDVNPDDQRYINGRSQRLQQLGDKYQSGKFALPPTYATGIAGGGRREGRRKSATLSAEALQLDAMRSTFPAHQQHLRMTSSYDEALSELGSADESAEDSDVEDDSEETDTSDDDNGLDGTKEVEQVNQAIQGALKTITSSPLNFTSHDVVSVSGDHAASLQRQVAWEEFDQDEQSRLRDAWLEHLLTNDCVRDFTLSRAIRAQEAHVVAPFDLADILSAVEQTAAKTTVAKLSADRENPVEVLEVNRVRVALQGGITEMQPSALRFWDKLGLSPASGPRQVRLCLLYLSFHNAAWIEETDRWIQRLSRTYQHLNLGHCSVVDPVVLEFPEAHSLAEAFSQLSMSPEQREDTLRSIYSRIQPFLGPDQHVAIYAVGQPSPGVRYGTFLTLEDGLRCIGKEVSGTIGAHVSIRPTPWPAVARSTMKVSQADRSASFKSHAFMLYQSLATVVEHRPASQLHSTLGPKVASLRPSLFALAPMHSQSGRSNGDKVFFQLNTNATNDNATSEVTILHVAYDFESQPDGFVGVTIVDESAQAITIRTRRRGSKSLRAVIDWIWSEVVIFMNQAHFRWRVVLCKARPIDAAENEGE